MTDPVQQAYEAAFPVVNQLRQAGSHQARALILLQLSDTVVHEAHADMELACIQLGFAAGQAFLVWRVAALCRVRDAHGMLPTDTARELEAWRQVMSRVAAGEGADAG